MCMKTARMMFPWLSDKERECQSITAHRRPTQGEIAFGYGAEHYRDFPIEKCINRHGKLKLRLFAKDGQLWYTIA